ncbi:hypothetical protein [Rhodococcus artemisiae]|uniref:Uncharacterized protein n=1 Tax=Rhodococcus artemisiae TaxID=714159 RepID=A0ABU7L9Y5_9NOCA|nr:hypothetical protein [Rhodococcus artemisiae]MEE2058361.1 hypothetical protein [Rhodococcus artemisiae]
MAPNILRGSPVRAVAHRITLGAELVNGAQAEKLGIMHSATSKTRGVRWPIVSQL